MYRENFGVHKEAVYTTFTQTYFFATKIFNLSSPVYFDFTSCMAANNLYRDRATVFSI